MDILQILTTGITGMAASILVVFMALNFTKAGYFGPLSRWVKKVADEKEKYGGRLLFLGIIFSAIINLIQRSASTEAITTSMLVLRIIGCSFMATGGYEYVKTIAKNLPSGGE